VQNTSLWILLSYIYKYLQNNAQDIGHEAPISLGFVDIKNVILVLCELFSSKKEIA